jgi:hypothetical protein
MFDNWPFSARAAVYFVSAIIGFAVWDFVKWRFRTWRENRKWR